MQIEKRNPKIYLISGKAKHGKDTFSGFLKEVYEEEGKKIIITQLSKYIKYYAREMTGWDLSEENKPRELLQQLGTAVIREYLQKEDLFINRMIEDVDVFSCFYDAIVISDVRLKKEIYDLKEVFPDAIVVHVERPNFDNGLSEEQKMHKTEVDLDDFDNFDVKIINTTLDLLKEDAKKLFNNNER